MSTSHRLSRLGKFLSIFIATAMLVTAVGVAPASSLSATTLANRVVGWGFDGYCCPYEYLGQATPPTELTDVMAISAGDYYSLALRGDATVVGWGNNEAGEASPPATLTDAVAIAVGDNLSLALRSDGTVVGWGQSADGRTTPPAGLTGVTAIAAGQRHSLAIASAADVLDLDIFVGPAAARTLVYSRGPVALTSGGYVVNPSTGRVTSITGTGTVPGEPGSTVTFNVTYSPATLKYQGTVNITGDAFRAHISVRAWRFGISRSADSVSGTLYGIKALSSPQRCFKIDFRIDDLG